MVSVKKDDLDMFYHLLRKFNELDRKQREILLGLACHLLDEPDYEALLDWLEYYGKQFIVPHVLPMLEQYKGKFFAVVELGAGKGWLGRAVAKFLKAHYVPIDKRKEFNPLYCLDLEKGEDLYEMKILLHKYYPALVVMSEFLHCVENPEQILGRLHDQSVLIMEHKIKGWAGESFRKQLEWYGCNYKYLQVLPSFFKGRKVFEKDIYPYHVWLSVVGT
jgi:hypothetical protein